MKTEQFKRLRKPFDFVVNERLEQQQVVDFEISDDSGHHQDTPEGSEPQTEVSSIPGAAVLIFY